MAGIGLFRPDLKIIREKLDRINPQNHGIGLVSQKLGTLEFKFSQFDDISNGDWFKNGGITDNPARMLANISYQVIEFTLDSRRKEPMYQFFRHLRNAASHGGKWNLVKNEPRIKAEWRGIAVTQDLHGRGMFEIGIGPGDILLLLWDIEQDLKNKPLVR